MTAEERAQESNLFLLCHDCHKKIDSTQHRDSYSVEFLESKKHEHEQRVLDPELLARIDTILDPVIERDAAKVESFTTRP